MFSLKWLTAFLGTLIVLQPFVFLVAGVGAGVTFGDRVGLRSWLTARLRGDRPPLMQASGLAGAAFVACGTGAVVVLLDRFFAPWIGVHSEASLPDMSRAIMVVSYGGITEELVLRYGLMTFLVWAGARVWTTLSPGYTSAPRYFPRSRSERAICLRWQRSCL